MKRLIALIAAAAGLTGCFQNNLWENAAKLSSDKAELVVPSKSDGSGPLADTLVITANRSWTADVASVDDGSQTVDWVTLIQAEGLNISGCSEAYPLIVCFMDNDGAKQRCAEIKLHCNGGVLSIPVTQKRDGE